MLYSWRLGSNCMRIYLSCILHELIDVAFLKTGLLGFSKQRVLYV